MMLCNHRNVVKTLLISTIISLIFCSTWALPFSIKPDEVATVVGKAFSHKLPAEMTTVTGFSFKFRASGSENLPSWLAFDEGKNLLLGVPSHHDKGSHGVQLEVINKETNKTIETYNFLTIEVVQYEEDLNHFNTIRTNTLAQPSKNSSHFSLDCPGNTPVVVATLVFDLNARKLSGMQRVELLKSVSQWTGVEISQLRWIPGKGDKTAFNIKDVIVLTAGPGWVKDPQERCVSVSWKIACGDAVAGKKSVSRLKSASETEAFKREFSSPVVAWHVTYGHWKHRQVVRVRRQAPAITPVPTSVLAAPATRTGGLVGTPTITISPSVFTVTPTAARISPSPSQGIVVLPTPRFNTPPFLAKRIPQLTAEIGVPFLFRIPPYTFNDKEDGDTPNLKLDMYNPQGNPLPNDLWLKLDSTQTLVGTPEAKDLGDTVIALIVTDRGNLKSELLDVTISVVRDNTPPLLYNHIDLIELFAGQPVIFPVPYDTFYDKEDGNTANLTLSMTTIDGNLLQSDKFPWVSFDVQSQTIYALPMNDTVGRKEFHMVATDSGGKKAIDAFEFHVNLLPVKPNYYFGLVIPAPPGNFEKNVRARVELCSVVGQYFGSYFNTSYADIRVRRYWGSAALEWTFGNIPNNQSRVETYKEKYVAAQTEDQAVATFADHMKTSCPFGKKSCHVEKAYVVMIPPPSPAPDYPGVAARVDDRGDGEWWEYTIIPAFVIAALILIIGLIIIICLRCRRKTKLDKNEKVVFVQRKKPAVFREEYPMKEAYGNQPLVTPNEKAPLPPPAYPRSSTPTEDPNEPLLAQHSSPSYQPPFDSSNEPAGNSRPPVASYRLPPPYVAP